jgi:hypothetical protein
MGVKITNNASGTLAAAITSGATTLTLTSGQGALFPTLGVGDYCWCTLVDTSNNVEIIKVTARSTDTLTMTRGQDNTTAQAFAINDRLELRPTAALFAEFADPAMGGDLTGTASNAQIAANAVGLAEMAGGTDGNLITYDASGDPAYVTTGTSGQVLTSGGVGVAPTFQTAAGGGLYASVAVIQDQKASGTSGGTFTGGAWRTRDLNTEVSDTDGIVSIASNQFTLQTGTYTLGWSAPGYDVDAHRTRIYNTSDAASVGEGSNVYTDVGGTVSIIAVGYTVFTIASGPKTFELQHFSAVTKSANGLGTNCNFSGEVEVYATVKILKHS